MRNGAGRLSGFGIAQWGRMVGRCSALWQSVRSRYPRSGSCLGGPLRQAQPQPSPFGARTKRLLAWLAADPTDDHLFRVAATFGEIILEKRIQRWVANDMLEGACQANGLWKSLGPDRCRMTIANAYRHVEEKFLGER